MKKGEARKNMDNIRKSYKAIKKQKEIEHARNKEIEKCRRCLYSDAQENVVFCMFPKCFFRKEGEN